METKTKTVLKRNPVAQDISEDGVEQHNTARKLHHKAFVKAMKSYSTSPNHNQAMKDQTTHAKTMKDLEKKHGLKLNQFGGAYKTNEDTSTWHRYRKEGLDEKTPISKPHSNSVGDKHKNIINQRAKKNPMMDYFLNPHTKVKDVKIKEDVTHDPKHVKMAIGITADPRHAGGDYSGAHKKIEKIAKGLSNHPQVADALRKQNEDAPANAVGGGAIAGTGVGPEGEPGVMLPRKKGKKNALMGFASFTRKTPV